MQEKQIAKKLLTQQNNFLESDAGKDLMKKSRNNIRVLLKALLDTINEKEPDLKAKFYLNSARLKAELELYKTFSKVKKELQILEESLLDDDIDTI